MKITEAVRKYTAAQGIAEEEALKKGMEEKSKEFSVARIIVTYILPDCPCQSAGLSKHCKNSVKEM
jgi:phosphomethylpyrimidine synthase